MTRIAFIGAGSVEFTRNLLGDIFSFPELADAEIVLHDIDEERLATAEAMARWTNDALGARGRISTTADRRRALDGADFAVNVIQVGGHAATLLDFEIPRKYGLRQTIADTSGVGAVFRALRTIPVMLGIADDMAELCPGAWMLNYTNPMAMNCWAWYAGSPHQNIVGLCHSIQNTSRQVAEYVGVPPEEITFHGAGVNHMSWVLRVEHDGRSLYPALDAAIAADPEGLGRHVRVQIYKRFGYFPTESSEHFAEYVPWFMRDDGRDRASAHPRGRVHPAQRGEPRDVRRGEAHAGRRRALRDRAQRGVRGAHHPLHGHRRAADRVRQRAQHRPHHQPAPGRLRGGAVPGRPGRAAAHARGRPPGPVRGARPDLPQRRRADRARGARRRPPTACCRR